MEINSNLVNTVLKETTKTISWRDIMMYATAINDPNPFYLDDEREGGIVSHPVFPVTLTLPLVENLHDNIGEEDQEKFPFEVLLTAVHYSEHIKLHRLIRPDDSLTLTGNVEAIIPHRAGTHVIIKFDGVDSNNQPVFTEYTGGMLRGVECLGGDQGTENIPHVPVSPFGEDFLWRKELKVSPLQAHIYDGCVGPTLPFHTSKEIAHQLGLPDILLQGLCTLAFAVSEIISEEFNGDPTHVSEVAGKFTSMIIPNSEIELRVNGKNMCGNSQEIFFEVYNQENRKAIREGYVKVI